MGSIAGVLACGDSSVAVRQCKYLRLIKWRGLCSACPQTAPVAVVGDGS